MSEPMRMSEVVLRADAQLGAVSVAAAASMLAPVSLRGRPQDVLIVLLRGRELGIPPMAAMAGIHVIDGRAVLSADLMVGVAMASGLCSAWSVVESTDERAVVEASRTSPTRTERVVWTRADSERAGLFRPTKSGAPSNHTRFPAQMFVARAQAIMARRLFPERLVGLYTADELDHDETPAEVMRTVAARPAAPIVDAEVLEERAPDAPSRDTLLAAILAISDDAPDYIESMLARDGLDLGTAPIGRVQGALTYLGTQRGCDALAAYVAQRDAALNAEVRYDHDGE